MKISLKIFLSFLLVSVITSTAYSQADTTKIKKIDTEINVTKSTNQLKATSQNKTINPKNQLNLNIDKKVNTAAINKQLKTSKSNNNSNFLLETLPEDQDIIGKKYWNNKDVTHKKLESTMSLGTIYSTTKEVRVECRDHSAVDGDIIKIYINENPLPHSVVLKRSRFTVYLKLNEGYNRIDFQAMNQGLSGPNTAELLLFDTNNNLISSKEWNLLTGQTATLGIIKK